ncbi:glucose-1-phosphate thymidylyltransferase RfbA [Nonomuraea sp. NPDC050643]|uniref:glucose-1-phosphate thymidylyltransferase RfbA n=1 Tax=Nonomuraea sp. NPDC050643 TaxID=3155660 RepID=UPI0033F00B3A
MKGIVLAGGKGTRLSPLTQVISKQLLPIYDKPLIYYPLSVLMLADIRDILIVSTPQSLPAFRRLFGDGSHLGLNIGYARQDEARGIAHGLLIGADHAGDGQVALVLGDNIFHGTGFSEVLAKARQSLDGCVLFGYPVTDPHRYGIAEVDDDGRLVSVEEKPSRPKSDRAVTGLYFYDNDVFDIARSIRPSDRGELEITDVNRVYVEQNRGHLEDLGRGFAWLDAGTHQSLLEAGEYVRVLESRQGVRIACLEEIALRMGFIDSDSCYDLGRGMIDSSYGRYVMEVASMLA